ncbi:hypothetical protein EDB84DRAFT_1551552, partial [Lactarius hengduanensis]
PPSARMGKGGGAGVVCPRVPPSRAYGAERGCRGRRGERAACPRAPPFRANGEGWGPGVACPRVPPSRAYACPFPARTGRRGQRGREAPGREGEGSGGVPLYAPLLCEWAGRSRGKGWDRRRGGGGADRGQGEAGEGEGPGGDGVPSCTPPFLVRPLSALERGGGQCGGKGRRGRGATYLVRD